MNAASTKLSFGEKFGYGLGDMAANFVFQAMMALQLNFYTDTFGLTPAQLLVTRDEWDSRAAYLNLLEKWPASFNLSSQFRKRWSSVR